MILSFSLAKSKSSTPKRYNPRKRNKRGKLRPMKLAWLIAVVLGGLTGLMGQTANPAPSPWERPAAVLTEQIAGILGPGQARLTIRNVSTIPSGEIPAIRLLLEQDLKAHGVLASGAESANSIRVTLSEDALDGLWVAEVGEGNETRVAMVGAGLAHGPVFNASSKQPIMLRKQLFWSEFGATPLPALPRFVKGSILAASGTNSGLIVVTDEGVATYALSFTTWSFQKRFPFPERSSLPRDARAILIPAANGSGFKVFTAGLACAGDYALPADPATKPRDGWTFQCRASDDPWPIAVDASGAQQLKAFYNAERDYFTGVVTPSLGVDLPPFYSAALVPRAAGPALLIGGIDGKVQILEGTSLKPVAGTRDWGSDFAVLNSGCGAGAQIIASGSGEAASDSLRAYELPAQEAVAASAPLAMDGTVTALWSAPDGKSVYAVVRGAADEYEVDRVTASCNE